MWIGSVYEKPEHAKELTRLLENSLPFDKMATGMGDFIFATQCRKEHSANEEAFRGLAKYPNLGERLVIAGLNSPIGKRTKSSL
jgi:hypothetical protein